MQACLQALKGMGCNRGMCCEQVLVQLMGGPLHDGCVHPVLHGQHGTSCAPKLALQPFKQGLAQALHSCSKMLIRNLP